MRMINNANYYYNRLALGDASNGYWKMNSITIPRCMIFITTNSRARQIRVGRLARVQRRARAALLQERGRHRGRLRLAGHEFRRAEPAQLRRINIRLDINSHLTNGQPTRITCGPFIGGSAARAATATRTNETTRATGYSIRSHEEGPRWLGLLLGRHTMSGAYTDAHALSGIPRARRSPARPILAHRHRGNPPVASAGNKRGSLPQVRYVGNRVLGLASAADLRVQPLAASQWPTDLTSVRVLYHSRRRPPPRRPIPLRAPRLGNHLESQQGH